MPTPGTEPPAPPSSQHVVQELHGSPLIVQVMAPTPPSGSPPRKSPWERFIQLLPLLQALVLFVLGYVFINRVANAVQVRQLELNNVKEMQSLMARLYQPQAPTDLTATVAALTAFRNYAVPPLTQLLQSHEPNQRTAAEAGLRALALSDSAAVTRQLLRIVGSRNRICSWRMLQSATRLLGDLGCRAAAPHLRGLLGLVSGPDRAAAAVALSAITDPAAPPDSTQTDDLKATIEATLARLDPPPSGAVR